MNKNEYIVKQRCSKCNGAGLLHDTKQEWSWCVVLCHVCNGHGYLLNDKVGKKFVAYDAEPEVAKQFKRKVNDNARTRVD